jgi:hypothetical protein
MKSRQWSGREATATGELRQRMMTRHTPTEVFEIRLQGHLDTRWASWFEGMAITLAEDGDTVLTGLVADQAALHGLLKKVRDLGMPLRSVGPIAPRAADESKGNHHQ